MIEFRAMGCQVTVQLEADNTGREILKNLPERVAALEAHLTRFNPDSELMRLNAHAGEFVVVSEVLFTNIQTAKHAAMLTDGFTNPLVLNALVANGYDRSFEQIARPMLTGEPLQIADWHDIDLRQSTREVRIPAGSALDLGGTAKGWTTAYLADDLAQYGACLVNMGGDMTGSGTPQDLPGWLVEIEDPFTHEAFETLYLHNTSIATSGTDYRRWQDRNGNMHHHIIDPRTGKSAESDVLSATVIHPHAPTADAFAKTVLLKGAHAGLNWLNAQWHTAGLIFMQDGTALATSTLAPLIFEGNN